MMQYVDETEEFGFMKEFLERNNLPAHKYYFKSSSESLEEAVCRNFPNRSLDMDFNRYVNTACVLYSVGRGSGLSNLEVAKRFIDELRRDVLEQYEDKRKVFPCDLSDKYIGEGYVKTVTRADPNSWELLRHYIGFNPEVVSYYTDISEGMESTKLMVLMRENLTQQEIQKIVSRAEKWRDFFLTVRQEFGEKLFDYYPASELILTVEDIALKADPMLERDYKDTGEVVGFRLHDGGDIIKKFQKDGSARLSIESPRTDLFVDGVKRVKGTSSVILKNTRYIERKSDLLGKTVDFHIGGFSLSLEGIEHFGNLLRIHN